MTFEYTGKNKTAYDLKPGDMITLTGYIEDVAEVEGVVINPLDGKQVLVNCHNGLYATVQGAKLMRLYQ